MDQLKELYTVKRCQNRHPEINICRQCKIQEPYQRSCKRRRRMKTNRAIDHLEKLGTQEFSMKRGQCHTNSPTFEEVSLNPIPLLFSELLTIHAMTELETFHLRSPFCAEKIKLFQANSLNHHFFCTSKKIIQAITTNKRRLLNRTLMKLNIFDRMN